MSAASQPSTRERLLDAAIALFARQGYAETSIADIQRECGLAPGSGALYRHFDSKRELLEAATDRYVQRVADYAQRFDAERIDNLDQTLAQAAMRIWEGINENALLLRVIFREPGFPDLADQLWSAITENAYRRFARGLRTATDAGMAHIADPEATAAVLVASLAYYPMVGMLIGHTPGEVDQHRYLEAWISHARAVLGVTGRPERATNAGAVLQ